MTTRICVRTVLIKRNKDRGSPGPVLLVLDDQGERMATEVEILGPSRVVYSPHEPILPCGARLVVATESEVRVVR